MRAGLAAAVSGLTLAIAGSALAQSPTVNVSVGADLQRKVSRMGERDVEMLKEDLAESISKALGKSGAQRADLVLEAVTPNRPTFEQMRRQPSLSFSSIGVGGASISGTVTLADGSTQPISYRWYENNLLFLQGATTWYDAQRAFDLLSYRIARGDLPNQGPHRIQDKQAGIFGYTRY